MMKNTIHNIFGFFLFFLLVIGFSETSISESMGTDSLEWMTVDSDVIVIGKVIGIEEFEDKQWGKYKEISIEVSNVIKNEAWRQDSFNFEKIHLKSRETISFVISSSLGDVFAEQYKESNHNLLIFLKFIDLEKEGASLKGHFVPRTEISGIIDLDALYSNDTETGVKALRKILWSFYTTAPISVSSIEVDDECFINVECVGKITPRINILTDRTEILRIVRYWVKKFELVQQKSSPYRFGSIGRRRVYGAYPIDLCCGEVYSLMHAGSKTFLYIPVIKELKAFAIDRQTDIPNTDIDLLKTVSVFNVDSFMENEYPQYVLSGISFSSTFRDEAAFVVRRYELSSDAVRDTISIGVGIFDTPEQAADSQYKSLLRYSIGCVNIQPEIGNDFCAVGFPADGNESNVGDIHFTYKNVKVFIQSDSDTNEKLALAKQVETTINQQMTFDGLDNVEKQAALDWGIIKHTVKKPAEESRFISVEAPVKEKTKGYLTGDTLEFHLDNKTKTISNTTSKYRGQLVHYITSKPKWTETEIIFNLFMATETNYIFKVPVEIVFE